VSIITVSIITKNKYELYQNNDNGYMIKCYPHPIYEGRVGGILDKMYNICYTLIYEGGGDGGRIILDKMYNICYTLIHESGGES
jgi:hypothetical protein